MSRDLADLESNNYQYSRVPDWYHSALLAHRSAWVLGGKCSPERATTVFIPAPLATGSCGQLIGLGEGTQSLALTCWEPSGHCQTPKPSIQMCVSPFPSETIWFCPNSTVHLCSKSLTCVFQVSGCHFGCWVLGVSMSHIANVRSITFIISWLIWPMANIQMAGVKMSRLRNMEWKYASGRSASSVCVLVCMCVCVWVGERCLPNSSWQNSTFLGHFLHTAIRPNQSSCSVLKYYSCTNQLHLAAPLPAKGCTTLPLNSHTHTYTHLLCAVGSGHRSKVQSEIITLILLGLLELGPLHLTILHM